MKAFHFYADYLAIIKGHGFDVTPILLNHFIHIYYQFPLPMIDYTECLCRLSSTRKLFCCERIPKYLDNPIKYIKSSIDARKYLVTLFNRKYLPPFHSYVDWFHEYMVIGYDDEKETFFLAGYWGKILEGELQTYSVKEFKYTDIAKAMACRGQKTLGKNYVRDLEYRFHYRCWLPKNYQVEEINIKKLKFAVFLYANKILPWSFNSRLYSFFRFGSHWLKKEGEVMTYNHRLLKEIEEHAKLMQLLIETYSPAGSAFSKEYTSVTQKAELMLVLWTKSYIQQSNFERTTTKIDNLLLEIKRLEEDIMKRFYKEVMRHI